MKNILIVDDDRSIRHILKEALSGEKFNTDIVQDAESAIKLIEKNLIEINRNWHLMWSTFYFHKKHYGLIKKVFQKKWIK